MNNYRLNLFDAREAERAENLNIDWAEYPKEALAAILEIAILDHWDDFDGVTHDYKYELDTLMEGVKEQEDLVFGN